MTDIELLATFAKWAIWAGALVALAGIIYGWIDTAIDPHDEE